MNRFELLNLLQDTIQEELVVCNIGLPSQEFIKLMTALIIFICWAVWA